MADPSSGVSFAAGAPGASRPLLQGEQSKKGEPFFRVVNLLDVLLEGVRVAVEVDFDEASIHVRNVPSVVCEAEQTSPSSLAAWLAERARAMVMKVRHPGELDCPLFREHVEHLHDLMNQGTLDGDLAATVLSDRGAQWIMASHILPDEPEAYHFYVVIPAGMELELL
ncbi:unnamed protein product [Polarella glacialis]|uniref:Uncharacterized protein n=2 Tax=Polarella glacialis TaxID=89957 RepID=A0A813I7I2_POLGL|nr:unnamed protein product [Polarella glacialis]